MSEETQLLYRSILDSLENNGNQILTLHQDLLRVKDHVSEINDELATIRADIKSIKSGSLSPGLKFKNEEATVKIRILHMLPWLVAAFSAGGAIPLSELLKSLF